MEVSIIMRKGIGHGCVVILLFKQIVCRMVLFSIHVIYGSAEEKKDLYKAAKAVHTESAVLSHKTTLALGYLTFVASYNPQPASIPLSALPGHFKFSAQWLHNKAQFMRRSHRIMCS